MQISSRFTIAIHMLVCIDAFQNERRVTSDFMAESIGVNPVVIRRILLQLKAADIVQTRRGRNSVTTSRPLNKITLYDIYKATDCVAGEGLFHFHENPNPDCPVGKNIHRVLDAKLAVLQKALENEMKAVSIADIANETNLLIKTEA